MIIDAVAHANVAGGLLSKGLGIVYTPEPDLFSQ